MNAVILKAKMVLTMKDLPFCDEFKHWHSRSACRAWRSPNEVYRANHWSRQGIHNVMISQIPLFEVYKG